MKCTAVDSDITFLRSDSHTVGGDHAIRVREIAAANRAEIYRLERSADANSTFAVQPQVVRGGDIGIDREVRTGTTRVDIHPAGAIKRIAAQKIDGAVFALRGEAYQSR